MNTRCWGAKLFGAAANALSIPPGAVSYTHLDAGKFSTVCTGKAELCNEKAEASDGQHLSEEIL